MKKSLLLAALAFVGLGAMAQNKVVVVPNTLTNVSELTAGKKYLIYDHSKPNNTDSNRRAFRYVNSTEDKTIYGTATLEAAVDYNKYVWEVGGNATDGWTFKNVGTDLYIPQLPTEVKEKMYVSETAGTFNVTLKDGEGFKVVYTGSSQAWDGMADLNMVSWGAQGNDNAFHYYHFYEVTDDMVTDKCFTVNITFKSGSLVVGTQEIYAPAGTEANLHIPDFCSCEQTTYTVPEKDTDVDIPVSVSLPFAYTAEGEAKNWQLVRMHGTGNTYYWQYTEGSDNLIAADANAINNINGASDNMLWAFVGNLKDGFKIYNKAAGDKMTMAWNSDHAEMSATGSTWKVAVSRWSGYTDTDYACCFSLIDWNGRYLNRQDKLQSWTDNDLGSTCVFYSLATPVINYVDNNIGNFNFNADDVIDGVVGRPDNSIIATAATLAAKVNAAKEAAANSPYDAEKIAALTAAWNKAMADWETAWQDVDKIAFDASKWYRFENVGFSNEYMVAAGASPWIFYGGEQAQNSNANSLFAFRAVPDREDRYYITAQGSYMGKVTMSAHVQQVAEDGDRAEFTLITPTTNTMEYVLNDATYTGTDGNNRLHQANHSTGGNQIVGWNTIARNTFWYLHPATDLEVSLPVTEGEEHIGTGYFPFPVKATDGVKLYSISEGVSNTNPNEKVLVYAEVENVAAETPFLMIGSAATATLAIDYDGVSAAAMVTQPLVGNYRSTEPEDDVYVLNGKAFVKTTGTSVSANSAYIPADNVSDANLESYALVDTNSGTTGIEEIGAEAEGKTVIFDLQGRRLAAPVRGINIINGRKVIVK